MGERITIGTLEELRRTGCLTGKAGTQPICVLLERRRGRSPSTTAARTWASRCTGARWRAAC